MSHTTPLFLPPTDSRLEVLGPHQEPSQAGKDSHSFGQSASIPRALSQLLPLDGRLQMGPTPQSPEATLALPQVPSLPGGFPRPCEHKDGTGGFFFFGNPFQGSLQVELGYVISLVKKLPAGVWGVGFVVRMA